MDDLQHCHDLINTCVIQAMSFRKNIGCSARLAFFAFCIGTAVSLFIRTIPWPERLMVPIMPAVCTFLAAYILFLRDDVRTGKAKRLVRTELLAKADTPDQVFVSTLSTEDTLLLLDIRIAIASFFDVPAIKVPRKVDLKNDLRVDDLQPAFQFAVVDSVLKPRMGRPNSIGFSMNGLKTIDELATAIQGVITAQAGPRDLDFGVMQFNGIDAWDCSAIVDLPHPRTRFFTIHVRGDEKGPTELQRQRIRWLKVAYDDLWPRIAEAIGRLHPDLSDPEEVTSALRSWIGVRIGEHANDSIELVYVLNLPNEGARGFFVTVSESGVGEAYAASQGFEGGG